MSGSHCCQVSVRFPSAFLYGIYTAGFKSSIISIGLYLLFCVVVVAVFVVAVVAIR